MLRHRVNHLDSDITEIWGEPGRFMTNPSIKFDGIELYDTFPFRFYMITKRQATYLDARKAQDDNVAILIWRWRVMMTGLRHWQGSNFKLKFEKQNHRPIGVDFLGLAKSIG